MWDHYRKTFIPMQLVILVICLVMYLFVHAPIMALVPFVVMMEFFSIVGAKWAARMKRKLDQDQGLLK